MIDIKIAGKVDEQGHRWLKLADVLFAINAIGIVLDNIKRESPEAFTELNPSDVTKMIKDLMSNN